ncbi:MAG: uroporphyrinogen decarboxylase family protein [Thermoproteota archaeon]
MNSKERVLTAFEHEEPDRVPVWCGASPEFWSKAKRTLGLDDEGLLRRIGDDFRRVYARYVGPLDIITPRTPRAKTRTLFGVERSKLYYGYALNHPLSNASLREVEEYPWPNPAWIDVSNIRADAKKYHDQYAILGGDWSPFWHDVMELLGMENMFVKMHTEPEIVDAVFEQVVGYYEAVNRKIFEEAADLIDIFFIGNDLGTKHGPMISEKLFRRFVLPHLKRLVDLGHSYGLKVMLHCCGGFSELIPAMVEIGLDGLHAVQPSCRGMDLRKLKKEYGDKILFNGAIDSTWLIFGTPEFVQAKTREVLEIMMPGGGYVAGASHDYILEETPVENVLTMFDTVHVYGRYR